MIFEFLYEKFASRVRVIQKSEFDWSSGYSLDPDDDYDDNDDDDVTPSNKGSPPSPKAQFF